MFSHKAPLRVEMGGQSRIGLQTQFGLTPTTPLHVVPESGGEERHQRDGDMGE